MGGRGNRGLDKEVRVGWEGVTWVGQVGDGGRWGGGGMNLPGSIISPVLVQILQSISMFKQGRSGAPCTSISVRGI